MTKLKRAKVTASPYFIVECPECTIQDNYTHLPLNDSILHTTCSHCGKQYDIRYFDLIDELEQWLVFVKHELKSK